MKIPKHMKKLLWPDDKKRQVLKMCGHYTLAEIAEAVGETELRTLACIRSMGASIKMIEPAKEVIADDT